MNRAQPEVVLVRALAGVVWLGALIGAGLVMWVLARAVGAPDATAVRDFAAERSPALTAAAHGLSWCGRSWVLVPVAVVIGGALRRRGERAWAPLVAVVGAVVIQNAIKALVDRPRPAVRHLEHVTSSSFPSGHATESTALLVALVIVAWPRSSRLRAATVAFAAALAGCVAASRIYLGVHYPTDVAAGIVLGGSWAAPVALNFSGRSGSSHHAVPVSAEDGVTRPVS